jgi:acyl-CoA dehydrogenase
MDFQLNAEQRAFADSVRDLLADRFDLAAVRAGYETGDGHPAKLWTQMGQQGWLAITVPESFDGLGFGLVEAQIVARALGAGVIPGPWGASTLAIEAIRSAPADLRERWLPSLAAGEHIGTHALEATVRFDGGTVSGSVGRVEYGSVADLLVLTDGESVGVVDLHPTGVRIDEQHQYDGTTRLAAVVLDGAPVATFAADVADLRRRGAVLAAADLVGVAREALRRTVEYDKQRVQFGQPVGSFQAIKHALADLHVGVTMAEHAVLYAAFALDAGLPDAELATAVAKAKASDTALAATAAMIQYHGGIGFTWEHDAHFFFKRAKRLAATFGDAATHHERIAAILLDPPVGPILGRSTEP